MGSPPSWPLTCQAELPARITGRRRRHRRRRFRWRAGPGCLWPALWRTAWWCAGRRGRRLPAMIAATTGFRVDDVGPGMGAPTWLSSRRSASPSITMTASAGRMQNHVLPVLKMRQTADMACVLCSSVRNPTDEDVVPKWLLRAFKVEEGSTIVSVREEHGAKRDVKTLRRFQVTLDGGLCKKCNNERLGGLEQVVQPILEPMAVRCEPAVLDLDSQRLLAVWAVKTVYLLELAGRQRYPGTRPVEGYTPSTAELGWLLAQLEQRR